MQTQGNGFWCQAGRGDAGLQPQHHNTATTTMTASLELQMGARTARVQTKRMFLKRHCDISDRSPVCVLYVQAQQAAAHRKQSPPTSISHVTDRLFNSEHVRLITRHQFQHMFMVKLCWNSPTSAKHSAFLSGCKPQTGMRLVVLWTATVRLLFSPFMKSEIKSNTFFSQPWAVRSEAAGANKKRDERGEIKKPRTTHHQTFREYRTWMWARVRTPLLSLVA